MNDSPTRAALDAAAAYETLFVPALFGEWAPRVVEAARVEAGQRVLDVACGTGVLARAAAARVGGEGTVCGVDLAAGMVALAARLAPDIEWREGAAEALPYDDGSFDAVVSQFGLMFFADRRQALREMRRVLAPDGRVVVAVWDSLANTPAYTAEVALLERIAGQRAAEALRAPFVMGDPEELGALLASAGFADVKITRHTGTGTFPSVRSMVEADLRGWLPVMGVVLPEDRIERILAEAEDALAPWVADDGRMVFDSPALLATGSKR